MTVLKVGFVGIRSDRLAETVALFRDVIGVPVTRQTDDLGMGRDMISCTYIAPKLAIAPVRPVVMRGQLRRSACIAAIEAI
jgi:hypothetical protein